MKVLSTLAVVAGLSAAVPAFAAPVTLDFEDQTSFNSINVASNPYGLAANGALLALANDGLGTGVDGEYFSNDPAAGSEVMFATQPLPSERAEINSTAAFTQSVSFYYSSNAVGSVSILDGTGGILQTFQFAANSTSLDHPFNTWSLATVAFNGLAHSVDFSGSVVDGFSVAAFDNLTINPVPLPAGLLLLPSGLAALGLIRRRKAVAA